MKLNEFAQTDHPSHLLCVSRETILEMLQNDQEVDTDAFLYVYKQLMGNLPPIAAERALDKKFGIVPVWNEHPMFGIASEKCADKWAVAYRENNELAERVFALLIERSNVWSTPSVVRKMLLDVSNNPLTGRMPLFYKLHSI